MEKQPFTNAGFIALQAWLYGLSDADLALEAQHVLDDFIEWMSDHFELTVAQSTFLNEISKLMISFLAAQTSIAIANRLPITLIKPEADGRVDGDVRKVIQTQNSLVAGADARGGYNPTGSLDIIIEYVVV